MKTRIVILLFLSAFAASACRNPDRDILYQVSTLSALQEGVYDGAMDLKTLGKNGDFGIGTFESLYGEMILLDGRFYQARADGKTVQPDGGMKTPFAVVTFFDADRTLSIDKPFDFDWLRKKGGTLLPSSNIPYAVRIEGRFNHVKVRSVPGQSKPYPRLVDVVKNQPEFEWKDIRGTIVGYHLPPYMGGINLVGFHLHFIDESGTLGGHLLEFKTSSGTIKLDDSMKMALSLPGGSAFFNAGLQNARSSELQRIER